MSSSGVTWGKIAYVKKEHLPLCLNTSMIRLKPKSKNIRHSFINQFIQSNAFKFQIIQLITGSAQPNFGPSHLKKIVCPLPPLDLQLEFEAILNIYNQSISSSHEMQNKQKEFLASIGNILFPKST